MVVHEMIPPYITVNVNDTTVATIVSNTTTGCPPLVVDFKAMEI
jgi:PKD repeat protein